MKSKVTKRLLYLSLNFGQLRGFFISICVWGNQETSLSRSEFRMIERILYLNLCLGDWEASLSRSESGRIERLLYLNLCLRWQRGFSILVWIWDDWKASLSQSVSRVTRRILYLDLNLGWLRGFSISIYVWGN